MRKAEVEISTPYVDARDGNNSRPYCVLVSVPASKPGRIKYDRTLVVRAPTAEGARLIRSFLLKQRRANRTLGPFLLICQQIQSGSMKIAQEDAARRYEERSAA